MFFNVKNREKINVGDIVDCILDMEDKIIELEQENTMLREQITDLKLGVA